MNALDAEGNTSRRMNRMLELKRQPKRLGGPRDLSTKPGPRVRGDSVRTLGQQVLTGNVLGRVVTSQEANQPHGTR